MHHNLTEQPTGPLTVLSRAWVYVYNGCLPTEGYEWQHCLNVGVTQEFQLGWHQQDGDKG
jgi:hypothetical protein